MKFKIQKKILFILFLVFVSFTFKVKAQITEVNVTDPNDYFELVNPVANSTIKGTIQIKFKIFDNNTATPTFNLELFRNLNCQDNTAGIISSGTVNSSLSSTHTVNWDTTKTLSSLLLSDGKYCLKLCSVLKNPVSEYKVCNSRPVTIANFNKPPVFNTTPTKLIFKNSETFTYKAGAIDPENDILTYRLLSTPGNLTLNSSTGEISSQVLSTEPGTTKTYNFTVGVEDGINPTVRQDITFVVKEEAKTTVNPPITNINPSPIITPTPSNYIANLLFNFTQPSNAQKIVEETFPIKWTYSGIEKEKIKNFKLSYSGNSKEWFEIKTDIDITLEYLIWDATKIAKSSYYLKAEFEDTNNFKKEVISNLFTLESKEANPKNTSEALIINEKPSDKSQLDQIFKPIISAELLPSLNSNVLLETVKITLDGKDINSSCKIEKESFLCTPKEPLSEGAHSVNAEFTDSSGKKAERKWGFVILSKKTESTTSSSSNTENTSSSNSQVNYVLIALIGLILLLSILIPWFAYFRKNKVKKTKKRTYSEYSPVVVNDLDKIDEKVLVDFSTPEEIKTDFSFNDYISPPSKPIDNSNLNDTFIEPYPTDSKS